MDAEKKTIKIICTLLYIDTDTLLVDTKTEEIYKDMSEDRDEFDFSDYPKGNPLYDNKNKKSTRKTGR